YLCTGLPLIVILLMISMFHVILPHWCGPAYVSLIPAGAVWLVQKRKNNNFPVWIRMALASLLVFMVSWVLLINFYRGTFGRKDQKEFGRGDVTLDRYGWRQASTEFSEWLSHEIAADRLPVNVAVVCNTGWAAHVEYYFCRPLKLNMIG